jgi:murein DD-endopeptidase MepM/ murein hydrolase activator NlpD
MKHISTFLLILSLIFMGCGSASRFRLFSKKTPHEQYADKMDDKPFKNRPESQQWLDAATAAVESPQSIQLPFKLIGNFQTGKPRALGLKFKSKPGEQLTISITKKASASLNIYADIFKVEGNSKDVILSVDSTDREFTFTIESANSYILRLQPELYNKGEYTLSISVGPSLAFPVSGSKARAGSFWGADRDGGKRSHEGIDIFAPKLTPVIAAADGVITRVSEGGIGGKVIWLRPVGKNISLYYAHLDQQLVQSGQEVKKGETIGLVGNTGNAKTTPSHLHFGVYTVTGPIDPYPFVNPDIKKAPSVPDKSLQQYLRLTKNQKLENDLETVKANTMLIPLAITPNGYISELPDGKFILVPFTAVQATNEPVNSLKKNQTAKIGS